MKRALEEYCKRLDKGVDLVRAASRQLRESLDLTGFCYVRVYHDGRVGWATSDADHDRFLIEKGAIEQDPLIDTAHLLREGHYLWFNDRKFPGCDSFYRDRQKFFGLDHGLVIVKHKKNYLETGCFSGCLSKKPLYNFFMHEKGLLSAYLDYFSSHLSPSLAPLLEEGLHINDLKPKPRVAFAEFPIEKRRQLIAMLHPKFLKLSDREKECLSLLGENLTYEEIALNLNLSHRTVEHYLQSVKDKLDLDTRSQLFAAAKKLADLGIGL